MDSSKDDTKVPEHMQVSQLNPYAVRIPNGGPLSSFYSLPLSLFFRHPCVEELICRPGYTAGDQGLEQRSRIEEVEGPSGECQNISVYISVVWA